MGRTRQSWARWVTPRQRGTAAVLAMLYMIVFSTLAIGFYSSVTVAAQLAQNDERSLNAQISAESGMHWMRYQLSRVRIPASAPNDKIMDEVYHDLAAQLHTPGHLGGQQIGFDGVTIQVPQDPSFFIPLHLAPPGAGFRASLTDLGNGRLRLKTIGRYRGTSIVRAIELTFESALASTNIFDYGIVSRSPITMDSNARIDGGSEPSLGGVLITSNTQTPLVMTGNSQISGDVSLVNRNGTVRRSSSASIAGETAPSEVAEHIHTGVGEPDFPEVDTSAFERFATNLLSQPGAKYDKGTLRNIRIKAGTNPIFDSNVAIEGVVFIETPNHVRFDSNVTVRGTIVVQNNPTGNTST
jgi:hypothetical protein